LAKLTKIFNLSSRKLTNDEIKILLRGLKFAPTPLKSNEHELQADINDFHRKLRLKDFFAHKNIPEDDSIVKNKSIFEPPKGRNQALEDYINLTKQFPQPNHARLVKSNISNNERIAMLCLEDDESIVIKAAGKGGGYVIMNKKYYKHKILDMLNDDTFYKQAHDSH